ncbi:integrase arm-type DNA-binding domain-containing protein [bacterium]|nr:integrase arm-type DNA-binding domain-containing protein [bacterium]
MKLSDAKIKAAKVPEGKKQIRLSDGGSLYLQVSPMGKYWRMNYRFGAKQKTLALGVYPQVSLKDAREKREASKKLLEQNIDPSQKKQADRRKAVTATKAITFEGIASEWISKNSARWVASTQKHTQAKLDKHILPWIGSLPIEEIEAQDILALVQRVEKRGTIETAHRLKMLCSQIFRYGIALGITRYDPTIGLQGALSPIVVQHRATITEPRINDSSNPLLNSDFKK